MSLQGQESQTGRASVRRRPAKKNRTSRSGVRTRTRTRSTRRGGSRSVAELERMIESLEQQIADLTSSSTIRSTIAGASDQVGQAAVRATNQVGDLVADSLTELANRVRGSAASMTGVARAGAGSLQKIGVEMERRPLMTVAIALGIGFLAAMVGRREAA